MDFRLYSLLCMVASAYCFGPAAGLLAKFNNCPQISGPSILEHLDVDNTGVERLVVYFYKARNSHQIVTFIPSREYQSCIEDIPENAGEALYNYNKNSIKGFFKNQETTIRYRTETTEITPESPLDIWPQPWNKYHIPHGSHEHDNTDDTAVVDDNAEDSPDYVSSSPNDEPVINEVDDDKRPDWHLPVEEPGSDDILWRPSPSSHEHPDEKIPIEMSVIGSHDEENPQDFDISVIESIPPVENSKQITSESNEVPEIRPLENLSMDPNHHDQIQPIIGEEIKGLENPSENSIIEPNHHDKLPPVGPNDHDILRPIIREEIDVPPIKPTENTIIRPNYYDVLLRPIIRDEIEAAPIRPSHHDKLRPIFEEDQQQLISESIEAPVLMPSENLNIESNHHDHKLRPIIREEMDTPIITPQENPIIPNRRDELPSSGENIQVNIDGIKHQSNSGEDRDIFGDTDHHHFGSKEMNGGLDINHEHVNSLIIPKGGHEYSKIEYGDSNESLNSQNRDSQEINALSHKTSFDLPSEEDEGNLSDHLNLVYKWHKVKVPRKDSSGKVYGWIWKSVRSPVRSKSVKWSYWQSNGKKHRLTHWKHKSSSSSSSKIYHHSSNSEMSVANFDGWLKTQIKNMQSKGNKMPSSYDDINSVKIAIEQALKTNGIRVESNGVLIDAEGNVLELDNIQLRPIYIGRSLAYNRILQNSEDSIKYMIPANTPFLEGLLVSLINPAKTLVIVPLGITALPGANSIGGIRKNMPGSGRELHPTVIQSRLNKLISGHLTKVTKVFPKLPSKETVKKESKVLSEEEPEFRIIGGSFAVGSGTPLANRGRSGKD